MKLVDIVKIRTNNYDLVVLEVLPDHEFDLIDLGFHGNETMFCLTKGLNHTCTVYSKKDGELHHFSWHWGYSGHTIVAPLVDAWGKMIQSCITEDYGIYIEDRDDNRRIKDCAITSINDKYATSHEIKAMVWRQTDDDVCLHMDGEFYKYITGGINAVKPYFQNLGYKIILKETTRSPRTSCYIYRYELSK